MATLIIGAGWLGRPLALHLLKQGLTVYVSNASDEGILQSNALGLNALQLQFPLSSDTDFIHLLQQKQIHTIIGCITPNLRQKHSEIDWNNYANKWAQISACAGKAQVNKVIMISSSAVYPALPNTMQESDASYNIAINNPNFSQKSIALLKGEQQLIDSGVNYVIIRCSGLVDEKRHPSKFISHLKSVSTQAPANMLHKLDAIGVTTFAHQTLSNCIINASTPNSCSKAEFYQAALNRTDSSLSIPEIIEKPDKQIDSQRSQALGYRYHFQHTLDLL